MFCWSMRVMGAPISLNLIAQLVTKFIDYANANPAVRLIQACHERLIALIGELAEAISVRQEHFGLLENADLYEC